ncbi:hypothetical protein EVAR_29677_1 [Eumeta japonica]|uniref:Uncharacterized protein n=1 Tax=Eumeta variegata TaxID=151549 RepID=A0A4C1WAB3_EUMVA|nr:hypothetical protein EVAR_29677_1 [Eumeta japonica]
MQNFNPARNSIDFMVNGGRVEYAACGHKVPDADTDHGTMARNLLELQAFAAGGRSARRHSQGRPIDVYPHGRPRTGTDR